MRWICRKAIACPSCRSKTSMAGLRWKTLRGRALDRRFVRTICLFPQDECFSAFELSALNCGSVIVFFTCQYLQPAATMGMVPLNLLMATRPLRSDETFVVTSGSFTARSVHEISFAKGQSLILVTRDAGSDANIEFAARQGGGSGLYSPERMPVTNAVNVGHGTGYGELPDGQKVCTVCRPQFHLRFTAQQKVFCSQLTGPHRGCFQWIRLRGVLKF